MLLDSQLDPLQATERATDGLDFLFGGPLLFLGRFDEPGCVVDQALQVPDGTADFVQLVDQCSQR